MMQRSPPALLKNSPINTFDAFVSVVLGTSLVALALVFDYTVYARAHDALSSYGFFDLTVAGGIVALTLIATWRTEIALLSLPVSAALMTAPQIQHLPFMREFGSYVLIGVILRLLFYVRQAGLDSCVRAIRSAIPAPILLAFFSYLVISFVPLSLLVFDGKLFEAKVLAAGLINEGLAILLVVVITTLASQKGDAIVQRLLDGLFAAAVLIVGLSVIVLPLQFLRHQHLSSIDFLGFYYYCRLQMTFFGPDHYCAFLAFVTPLFMLNARQYTGTARAWTAIICLLLVPILLVAGGSRAGRLDFALIIIAALFISDYRRLALGIGAFAALVLIPALPYRCLSDIVAVSQNMPITGGFVPPSAFFDDSARLHLLDLVAHDAAHSSILHILFGYGAELSAYIQFNIGGHSTYLDLYVDKGVIGLAIVAMTIVVALRHTLVTWLSKIHDVRLRTTTLVLMVIPIVVSAVTYDVRRWLFVWMFFGFLLANAAANKTEPASLRSRAEPALLAEDNLAEPATRTT